MVIKSATLMMLGLGSITTQVHDKKATAQDNTITLSLCKTDTPQLRNWFHYYWYKHTYFEPVPTVIDKLMMVSYFGYASNLLYLLHQPDPINPETSSRALYWAARQGHCACVILLLQQPGCDPQSLAIKSQASLLALLHLQLYRAIRVAALLERRGLISSLKNIFNY